MAVTPKNAGSENDGSTAAPALAKTTFGALAAGDTILVALNHTGIATASAPTAPFTLLGELVAPTSAESSLHVYLGTSADWSLEAANFTFPISTSRGGCLLGWFVAQGTVDMAAVLSAFDRETSATPTIGITPTRDGSYVASFAGAKPASGTITGTPGGTGVTFTESIDTAVSATSFLHGMRGAQALAAAVTAAPTFTVSASYAQAIVALQPPPPADTTPPTVTARTPAPGATGVLVTADVTATLSEALAPGSVDGSSLSLSPAAGGAVTLESGDTLVRLNPTSSLAYSTTYTATLGTGVTDVAGNHLAAPSVWTFTTEAAPPIPAVGLVDVQQYAFEVTDRAGVTLATLQPLSARLTLRLNGTSEATLTLLASDGGAGALEVYSSVIRVWRRSGDSLTGVRAVRFVGHVHALREDGDPDGLETVEVTARDPSAAFLARYQPWDSSWGPNTLAVAVAGLVGDANISAEDPAGLDATYGHGMGVLAVGAGWPSSTWAFTRNQPMTEAFRSLQEGDVGSQGFYWTVRGEAFVTGGILATMKIAVAASDLSPLAAGAQRPSLEYGPGTVNNVLGYSVDRVPPVNSVIAIGAGGISWKNDSESSGATYGLWPTLVSYPDVDTTARLDALARGVWHVFPVDAITVSPAWPQDPEARAALPRMFDHFDLGDSVPVLIRGARRTISGTCMVREVTVGLDAEGTERTTSLVLDLPATS